jgi:hypothetical protein
MAIDAPAAHPAVHPKPDYPLTQAGMTRKKQ